VRDDVAMTGEITLTGQVLPIGGLKEKALAAQRYGVKLVIAPKLNEPDCEDFPEHLRRDVEFRFLDHVEEVFGLALEPTRPASRARRRRSAAMLTPAAASKTREFNGSEEDSG
jgi:ATP-dependent Lon protease